MCHHCLCQSGAAMKRETPLNIAVEEFVYMNMVKMRSQVLDSEESQRSATQGNHYHPWDWETQRAGDVTRAQMPGMLVEARATVRLPPNGEGDSMI